MGLFGKKKNNEEQPEQASDNKVNSSISDEMKIILAAREEAQQEKQAKAEERQQAQAQADKEEDFLEEQARMAASKVLTGDATPLGMTFYVICDEVPAGTLPETEGNIIVRGNIRGTVKKDSDVFLYQGNGDRFSVKIDKIKNDKREFVDELTDERAELEITRGDIPKPLNPDEEASAPVKRYAVITDAKGAHDMSDPACTGMAVAGNPRTIAMLCEYGKFGKEPVYFGTVMDCLMTSEFVTPAIISKAQNGKSSVGFIGMSPKQDTKVSYLPVFTDNRLATKAINNFKGQGGPSQRIMLSFAQVAAVSRDSNHHGFLVNPGGPVTITIPKDLIDKMVETEIFKTRFGAGAGDNASFALGGSGNRSFDNFVANGGPDMPGMQKIIISNPTDTPEFIIIEKAVKAYCGAHADISKVLILIATPENNRNDRSYLCIMDCPDETFEKECKGLAEAMKPFLKGIKRIQFQQFSKMNKEGFPTKVQWLYSKLPQ